MKNYPRMLFPGGDATAEPLIVHDLSQEAAARREGYRIAGEVEAGEPKAPSKPAKKKAK